MPAHSPKHQAERGRSAQRRTVVQARRLLTDGHGLAQEPLGIRIQAQPFIGASHCLDELGSHLRLGGRQLLQPLGAAIEKVAGGNLHALRARRVRALEQFLKETDDLLPHLRFLPDAVSLARQLPGEEGHADAEREQGHRGNRADGHAKAMPPGEAGEAIPPRGWMRQHRLVPQMTLDVGGQFGG